MSAALMIRDGEPSWWNSPDIWVVPGEDPNGTPGTPIAGRTAYVWARVHNIEGENVTNAQVNYWWSNPAAGVMRSTSTLIGTSSVSLNAGDVKEVLCVVPWVPVIVNNGHECLVAEVIHPADPLPQPLPDAFSPATYRQIAQRNINVLVMSQSMSRVIQLTAPPRKAVRYLVSFERGAEVTPELLKSLGHPKLKPADKAVIKAGFTADPGCPDPDDKTLELEIALDLEAGEVGAVHFHMWPPEIAYGTYVPIDVTARTEDGPVGGLTFVATPAR